VTPRVARSSDLAGAPSEGIHTIAPPPPRSSAPWIAEAALTFTFYVVAVVGLTWPLASMSSTHLPHTAGWFVSDLYYLGWALSWQTHALVTDPARFADGNIYSPAPLAIFYGTPGFGLLPLFAPVFAATANPTLALDVAFLASLALTATTIHLVVVAWTGSRLAGVAAASTYLTSRGALDLCGAIPQYTALAAIAPIVWLLSRDHLTRRQTIGLAVLIAVQVVTDLVYVALPVITTVVLVTIARLAPVRSRADGRRIAIALVAAGCAVMPVYAGYVAVSWANPDLAHQTVWKASRKLWMNMTTFLPAGNAPMSLDALAFVPAIAGLLAMARARSAGQPVPIRAWRQAALWFGVSFAMSWAIPVLVPALRDVLAATMIRDIIRLGFVALVGLCLLTGLGFAACAGVASRAPALVARAAPLVLLLLWLATRIGDAPWPLGDFPVAPAPVPGPEAAVLRRSVGPVLELPVGHPDRETESHTSAMYRSTAHWRTLVNGYSSYYPHGFRERMELARQLPAPFPLEMLRVQTGLTTIVVHAGGFPMLTIGLWRDAIERGKLRGVRIEYVDQDVLVASVAPPD
jgi:hypothetical protein